jgi:glycosyltransferase involved in cell wall biosynthesis
VDRRRTVEVFVLFRDSLLRRVSLAAPAGSAERYSLYGADELAARGFTVRHSLEPDLAPRGRHRRADRVLRTAVGVAGGYGGDFATVLASRATANQADVVFSTVDTVGIPAMLLAQGRVLRPPLVYASIGLLERISRIRNAPVRRLYRRALAASAAVVAYGHAEAEELRRWLGPSSPPVSFVPFGVDLAYFRPQQVEPDVDVLSVGADPRRDYALLARAAARLSERSFRIVASAEQERELGGVPVNVAVEADVPFAGIRERLARARVVALPVRENLYSGATTTLLQAMAMGRPVVVSRTAAIADGYGLVDGENCRLVPPGDEAALETALSELLADEAAAASLGAGARETAERGLGWDRYVDAIAEVLREAATRGRSGRPR